MKRKTPLLMKMTPLYHVNCVEADFVVGALSKVAVCWLMRALILVSVLRAPDHFELNAPPGSGLWSLNPYFLDSTLPAQHADASLERRRISSDGDLSEARLMNANGVYANFHYLH